MKKSNLTKYILFALVGGILFGWLVPDIAVKMQPFAEIFLRMIKMIIAPLLFSTLVVGIAGHGNIKSLGKLGIKTIIYFEVATTLALLIGLFFANYFHPGTGVHAVASSENMQLLSEMQSHSGQMQHSLMETFVQMVPTSIFDSMASGNILQVVFFAVFFALGITAAGEKGKPIFNGLKSLSEIMFKFTEYVMKYAPMGVFAAIASTIGQNGISVLTVYAKLVGTLYLALFVFVTLVLVVACRIVNIPFLGLLRAIRDPALLAFSTASSEAALPKAMEIMEEFGVPQKIVGFVMPTGYTFNLDGSTLYLALASLFVAQMAGIHLSIEHQIMLMLTLMLTSKGVAGVPRVSLVILTGTLASFNIPLGGIALLLGIDQILDMGRTTVNLIGNCVATTVIARWENCFDYNKMREYTSNIVEKPLTKKIVPIHSSCEHATRPASTQYEQTKL